MTERDETLERIEHESERDRAELAQTLDALRRRASPGALRTEATDYLRHRGEALASRLEHRARENPLAALAVGAGLAYPALRIVREVPAPVMLLGAGLALAGRGSSGKARERALPSRHGQGASFATTTSVGSHAGADTDHGAPSSSSRAASGGAASDTSLEAKASALTDRALAAVDDAVSSVSEGTMDAATRAQAHITNTARATQKGVEETLGEAIERYPLTVGGLGALLGAALALGLPRSQAEDELFGDASAHLRRGARDGVSRGLAAAERTIAEARREAEAQGLTGAEARAHIRTAGERARALIDEAAEAAISDIDAAGDAAESAVRGATDEDGDAKAANRNAKAKQGEKGGR